MDIILATEIWGRTVHVDGLADALRPHARRVLVVDPYDGRDPRFSGETAAYAAYLDRCGHEEYARRVAKAVDKAEAPVFLVGFSAGAGAVWAAVCREGTRAVRACCFYGSAIRDMTDLIPQVPVDLVLPQSEPRFDVAALWAVLEAKPLTACHQSGAGHGFMNPLSANHDQNARRRWTDWLVRQAAELAEQSEP